MATTNSYQGTERFVNRDEPSPETYMEATFRALGAMKNKADNTRAVLESFSDRLCGSGPKNGTSLRADGPIEPCVEKRLTRELDDLDQILSDVAEMTSRLQAFA